MADTRENWGSRSGFVLAAIGSAVGLGNLWGFPYKLYKTGGGAFLIPYVIAMLFVGIPLLIAEFSLGHLTQRSTPSAFARIKRPYAALGWWQIILSFIIITYYAVILAWCGSFLVYSIEGIFNGSLPWAGVGVEGVKNAHDFFFKKYLSLHDGFSVGKLQTHIAVALVITWLAMYLCIFRGVKLVSKVVMWTVPLPWLMLLILTIRGLTLPGATLGMEYYLEPKFSQLADPQTWRMAFGQMFFSMSLAFGIMITYSSFLHRKSDLNNNATIIGLADMGTSFIAGIAVFATLGGMAFATQQTSNPIPIEKVAEPGPGLAFVAFPYALSQLPYAPYFSVVFFLALILLGIDSAFSITESTLSSIVDKTGWNKNWTLIVVSLLGLGVGLLYCCEGGLNWLGTFEDFINGTWGIALTALVEALVLGWLMRLRRLRDHANERSDWKLGWWWDFSVRVIIPIVMAALFAWSLLDEAGNPHYLRDAAGKLNIGTMVGLIMMAAAPVIAIVITSMRFKKTHDAPIHTDYLVETPKGRIYGIVALMLSLDGLFFLAMAFSRLVDVSHASKYAQGGATTMAYDARVAWTLLCKGGAFCLIATVIAGVGMVWYESKKILTSTAVRFGGAFAIMLLGCTVGLTMALWAMTSNMKTKPLEYNGLLDGDSYLVLFVMIGIIVCGLGWCFYRAIRAAGQGDTEEQQAEL